MEVIEYFKCGRPEHWLCQIGKSDWRAGRKLYEMLRQGRLCEMAGENPRVFMLVNGGELVSFCTYSEKDDIPAAGLGPWIGFVYTFPKYRGCRCIGRLFEEIERIAGEERVREIFISTDHVGVYEKYGFGFYGRMENRRGELVRVYRKKVGEGWMAGV